MQNGLTEIMHLLHPSGDEMVSGQMMRLGDASQQCTEVLLFNRFQGIMICVGSFLTLDLSMLDTFYHLQE